MAPTLACRPPDATTSTTYGCPEQRADSPAPGTLNPHIDGSAAQARLRAGLGGAHKYSLDGHYTAPDNPLGTPWAMPYVVTDVVRDHLASLWESARLRRRPAHERKDTPQPDLGRAGTLTLVYNRVR
jgi:hypothetical protein